MNESDEVSQRRLSRILSRSTRQIRNLEAEGLPHHMKGRRKVYDLVEVWSWMENRTRRLATPVDEQVARTRKLTAEAELRELELAERRSQLLAVQDMNQLVAQPLHAVATALRNAPARLMRDLAHQAGIKPVEAKALLRRMAQDMTDSIRELGNGKET